MVFLSGGITHASFGGLGIGHFMGINPVGGAIVFGVMSALGIEYISGKKGIRSDTAIGILWAAGMALGIIFIYLTPGYAPNLMGYLFGNILLVGSADLLLMAIAVVMTFAVFIGGYYHLLFTAFDQEFSGVAGSPVNLIRYLMAAVIAFTIIAAIKLVGVILLISFFTLPQATAAAFTGKFSSQVLYSSLISFAGAITGLIISFYADIPPGAAIIAALLLFLLAARLARFLSVQVKHKRSRMA
jgi:zinc transport system permease protein